MVSFVSNAAGAPRAFYGAYPVLAGILEKVRPLSRNRIRELTRITPNSHEKLSLLFLTFRGPVDARKSRTGSNFPSCSYVTMEEMESINEEQEDFFGYLLR